ncbi:MAG: hypothetical protein ACLFUE_05715 [Desulfobacteraceae bacterium]
MKNIIVEYSGKRLPITFSMPWLSAPVTFGSDRAAPMPEGDARRLCRENPGIFKMGAPVKEQAAPEESPITKPKAKTAAASLKKPSYPKKAASTKKHPQIANKE